MRFNNIRQGYHIMPSITPKMGLYILPLFFLFCFFLQELTQENKYRVNHVVGDPFLRSHTVRCMPSNFFVFFLSVVKVGIGTSV